MKKLLSIAALLAVSTSALAGFNENAQHNSQAGGYVGQVNKVTVAQALEAKDKSYVSVEGSIVKRLGDDDYLFQDSTGSIKIEIDEDVWQGQNVAPNEKIRITGEVDNDWNEKSSIDVDKLQKL